jgi:universal stress protein E
VIEHILVATDLSHRSEAALQRSAGLAGLFGATLTILHVVEHDQPQAYVERELEQAREGLAAAGRRLRDAVGSEIDVRALAGDPFEMIGDQALKSGADLIVLGSHRKRLLRDLFAGTTAERVIWRGTHPVLMVKRAPAGAYRRVGIATDCSEPSAVALKAAATLGLLSEVEIDVVHARVPFAKTMLAAHANQDAVHDHVVAEMQNARSELEQFLAGSGRSDLASHLHIREGEPMDVLRAFIAEREPDLLVMGTHGRSGIGRMLLGSVADEALRTLDTDILAVPQKAEG